MKGLICLVKCDGSYQILVLLFKFLTWADALLYLKDCILTNPFQENMLAELALFYYTVEYFFDKTAFLYYSLETDIILKLHHYVSVLHILLSNAVYVFWLHNRTELVTVLMLISYTRLVDSLVNIK